MKRVLLVCSSTDGQTRRICDRLQRIIEDAGDAVTLVLIENARDVSPAGFQMAVIGARIRYGRTDVRVIEYANRHAAALNAMPSAYFSVNIVARKPEKNRPETNPYVQAFLRRVAWRPPMLEVFAGKLDYPRYGALDWFNWQATGAEKGARAWFRPSTRREQLLTLVITDQAEAVGQRILSELHRGVTELAGRGMYTGKPHSVLMCALTVTEVHRLESLVRDEDPHAFIIVSPVQEVRGSGFVPLREDEAGVKD